MMSVAETVRAFLLGWVIPGAGHWMLGKRRKAVFLFAVIAITYLFGQWICEFRHVRFQDNPFYFFGRFGCGTMLGVALLADTPTRVREDLHASWHDYGLLYSNVAGLLNLIIVLNIITLFLDSRAPKPAAAATENAAAPTSGGESGGTGS